MFILERRGEEQTLGHDQALSPMSLTSRPDCSYQRKATTSSCVRRCFIARGSLNEFLHMHTRHVALEITPVERTVPMTQSESPVRIA